jgi:hypothetical protein
MINIFFRQGPSTFNNSAEVDGVDDAGQLMVGGMSGAKTASWSGGGGRERGGGAGGGGGGGVEKKSGSKKAWKIPTDCLFWLQGLCNRGDECKFLHTHPPVECKIGT